MTKNVSKHKLALFGLTYDRPQVDFRRLEDTTFLSSMQHKDLYNCSDVSEYTLNMICNRKIHFSFASTMTCHYDTTWTKYDGEDNNYTQNW